MSINQASDIPTSDEKFSAYAAHFLNAISPHLEELGFTQADIEPFSTNLSAFQSKILESGNVAALSKKTNAEKNTFRRASMAHMRGLTKRIKAQPSYTNAKGYAYGIERAKKLIDLTSAKPNLTGFDQTDGLVILRFTKGKTSGINIYSKRGSETEWTFLGHATSSPYKDNRPLLQSNMPELRHYTAVYMQKNEEVSQYSQEVVVNCAP